MSASVVNQAYSQQVNQAFDLFKTFTPQQMQQMGQQVAQKPNSPEAVAFASAAQYQQQMRAPQPQAPQGTIFQQKLQEFQQTSPQGLPSVGGNQMAMQQAAQQDPMRNAGIGAAPENMPAPQPQGQAATGGLVALAHGGEVRGFYDGKIAEVKGGSGYTGNKFNLEDIVPMDDLYNTTSTDEETDDTDPMGEFDSQYASYDETGGNEVTPSAPRVSIPATIHTETPQFKPKGSAAQIAKTERSSQDQISELEALMGSTFTASDSLNSKLEERLANSNRNAGIGALVGGIGGMLSAQTPYMSQALGAGLMSGLSAYQQGDKETGNIEDKMLALQLAQEQEKSAGHREAAKSYISTKAGIAAEDRARLRKLEELRIEGANRIATARARAGGPKGALTEYQSAQIIDMANTAALNEFKERYPGHDPQSANMIDLFNQLKTKYISQYRAEPGYSQDVNYSKVPPLAPAAKQPPTGSKNRIIPAP